MDTDRRKRRGHQEGAIYQRASDGLYCGAVHLGYDSSGKRLRRVFTAKSRTEVARKVEAAVQKARQGLPVPSERLTVETYLTSWLERVAAVSVKESTLGQYRRVITLHVIPTLGKKRLLRLSPDDLQGVYAEKLKTLSPSTVLYVHRVVHRALDDALRLGIVHRNVAALATLPRMNRTEVKAFSIDQARTFLAAASDHPLGALFLLALGTGLRRGEVLALRWSDIDLDSGTLAVRRSLMKVTGGWRETEPKTASSRRVVRIPDFARDALNARRLAGPLPMPTALVFQTATGTHIDGRNLLREFKALTKSAKLGTDFTFHSLRHSAATMMLALGVQPKVVMETLGHSRMAVTMDVYSHVLPHLQEEAAAKMNALLTAPTKEGGAGLRAT